MIKAKMRNFAIALMSLMMVASFAIGVASFSNDKVAKADTAGTYSMRTLSADNLTSTWTYNTLTGTTVEWAKSSTLQADADAVFSTVDGKVQLNPTKEAILKKGAIVYYPVPKNSAGTITFTGTSDKTDRFLHVNGDSTKQILMNRNGVSYTFTSADITTLTTIA